MDWASNLFIVLLITDITGTIFFLIGQLFRKRTNDDVAFLRFLTNVTMAAFLIPFVYFILYLGKRVNLITIESDINLFYGTPLSLQVAAVLGRIWIGLILALFAYRAYRILRWRMLCRGNIPEEDEAVRRVFDNICAEFGIGGKVSLCRNDSVDIPCITYYHGFTVILPLVNYTEKEAEVILCHELCHYLNRDLHLKSIGSLTTLIHVFNPAVHILLRQMDKLCETYCDRAACKKGKHRFTKREYFQVILEALVNDGRRNRYQLFALADDRSDYERRVAYMLNYQVKGGLKKGTAVVLALGFLMGSSMTSLAAGDGVAEAYTGLRDATSVKEVGEERADSVEDMEAEAAEDAAAAKAIAEAQGLDPATVSIVSEGMVQSDDGLWLITWTIPAGETYMSSGFREYVGDEVSVLVAGTPDDVDYQAGIKDPEAIMWCYDGVDDLYFKFVVDIKGRHYFFVTNLSETEKLHVEAAIAK